MYVIRSYGHLKTWILEEKMISFAFSKRKSILRWEDNLTMGKIFIQFTVHEIEFVIVGEKKLIILSNSYVIRCPYFSGYSSPYSNAIRDESLGKELGILIFSRASSRKLHFKKCFDMFHVFCEPWTPPHHSKILRLSPPPPWCRT